jgi:hypothetical protein
MKSGSQHRAPCFCEFAGIGTDRYHDERPERAERPGDGEQQVRAQC